jgi:predicted metal-dependent phosphoesterase TrpH
MRTWIPVTVLMLALLAGTASDQPTPAIPRMMGGYHVLAADFHVHTFPFGWSALSPRETLLEAVNQGLDVVAITPHVQTWQADLARWLGPSVSPSLIVLKGEEITTARFHVLAIGIERTISNRLPLGDTIDAIHEQRGIAIAAHPYRVVWANYDAASTARLDGSEVVRVESLFNPAAGDELREFHDRAPMTAFGDSDYHGMGPIGLPRTYVFATERSAKGVMDAIRAGRTVVYDREHAYGDPALVALAESNGGLPRPQPERPDPRSRVFSRLGAMVAIVTLLLFNRWNNVAA